MRREKLELWQGMWEIAARGGDFTSVNLMFIER